MSSPLGHSLAGYLIASYREKSFRPGDLKILFIYIFLANALDLDFIPGVLARKPNLYHHGISHSLGAVILIAALGALLIRLMRRGQLKRDFSYLMAICGSHLMIDLITIDGRPPLGIPLFWPLSKAYLMFPLLPPVIHSDLDLATFGQFFHDVFSLHNLYVIFLEIALMIPFAVMLRFMHIKRLRDAN